MSINLLYVEDTSEKLWRILRSPKIRCTFYTENTLRKLLCKPEDRVATEDKNNIVYEIDCSICEAVYFGESKRSLILIRLGFLRVVFSGEGGAIYNLQLLNNLFRVSRKQKNADIICYKLTSLVSL